MSSVPVIKAEHLGITFGGLHAVSDFNMEMNEGELVGLIGPNGAGKTTLLQILGSLDRPDSGKVIYESDADGGNATDLFSLNDTGLARFRNRNIGFVFQFHQLLPEFTMLENVAMPALIAGTGRAEAFARAKELIDYLGLGARASHRPMELSGGERQRAAVARALVNRPTVVLADEPSGSLDSANRAELHKLFFDLRRDLGHTFVIVTHDETLARQTDRMVCMADGLITGIIDNRPSRAAKS